MVEGCLKNSIGRYLGMVYFGTNRQSDLIVILGQNILRRSRRH